MTEPKITISIELPSGVGITLTLAEAKALRGQLNELLHKDEPIAQPITIPFISPVDAPKNPPGKITRISLSGEPLWVKMESTTVSGNTI